MNFYRKMLESQVAEGEIAYINVGNERPKEYLKWISYIPFHWHIDELYKKDEENLTEEEKNILKRREIEKKYEKIFTNYLATNKKNSMDVLLVYEYMKAMSINTYAKLKLTEEELNYCFNIIDKCYYFSKNELQKKIFELEQNSNRNMLEEYILYVLKLIIKEEKLESGFRNSKTKRRGKKVIF